MVVAPRFDLPGPTVPSRGAGRVVGSRAEQGSQIRGGMSYSGSHGIVDVYLLARQHIPLESCAEAMADLFGVEISTGTIDAVYADAAHRLAGFIKALVALLRGLTVLHADETTDRIGTRNCWMHLASTDIDTLIHSSLTRGFDAVVADDDGQIHLEQIDDEEAAQVVPKAS